jgi:hypothetical protein
VGPQPGWRSPLRPESSFRQLACILRVSSPRQLSITSIFEIASRELAARFPGGPVPFAHRHRTEHLEEALELALQCGIESEVVPLICSEWAFADNRSRRPKRRYFTASPFQPTLTQRASMTPLVQKIMTYQRKVHRIPHFRREHFVYVTACSPRLSRTSRLCYLPSVPHPTWRARTSSRNVGCPT